MSRRVQKKTVVEEETYETPETNKEEIIEAFEYFDRDGRGNINKDELKIIKFSEKQD